MAELNSYFGMGMNDYYTKEQKKPAPSIIDAHSRIRNFAALRLRLAQYSW